MIASYDFAIDLLQQCALCIPSTEPDLPVAVLPEPSWLDAAFDPSWNEANRLTIWISTLSALFLAGAGLPIPEDIPLTIVGFTTTKESGDVFVFSSFVRAFILVTIPILAGDLIAYGMGHRWGMSLRDRIPLARRVLTDQRLGLVKGWFDRRGSFAVFLGRQVAGVRFATFFTAGTMKMNVTQFLLFDFLGCVVSVPVWLSLGFLGARYGREWLNTASEHVGMVIGGVAVVAIAAYFFKRWLTTRGASASEAL